MLLSVVEYLDHAAEYDRLAREATKQSDKARYANLAECYRYFAREREKIPDAHLVVRASPSISPPGS